MKIKKDLIPELIFAVLTVAISLFGLYRFCTDVLIPMVFK